MDSLPPEVQTGLRNLSDQLQAVQADVAEEKRKRELVEAELAALRAAPPVQGPVQRSHTDAITASLKSVSRAMIKITEKQDGLMGVTKPKPFDSVGSEWNDFAVLMRSYVWSLDPFIGQAIKAHEFDEHPMEEAHWSGEKRFQEVLQLPAGSVHWNESGPGGEQQ